MPTPPAYETNHYPDSKSEPTYVEDRRMPTPWEGEVHELRDRVTNPYPPRPRDYTTTDDIIRQLRADTPDYRSETSRRLNNMYNSLCCGSKVGVIAWVVAVLGIAIALGVLLIRILKPDAFGIPADDPHSLSQPSIVTITVSSHSVSVITSIVSTFSTETESTLSTTTLITETTASTTTTLTYTPPTTATETETETQTTTSMATITPPSTRTVTTKPDRITVVEKSWSIITTTAAVTDPSPPNLSPAPELDSDAEGEENDDGDDNDVTDADGGEESKRNEFSTTEDDTGMREESHSRYTNIQSGGPPGTTPLLLLQRLPDSAAGSTRAALSAQDEAAVSFCRRLSAVSGDSTASSFCGPFSADQEADAPIPSASASSCVSFTDSPTTVKARRYFNVFARAAPLTSTLRSPPDDFPTITEVSSPSIRAPVPTVSIPGEANKSASPNLPNNRFITVRHNKNIALIVPTKSTTPPPSDPTGPVLTLPSPPDTNAFTTSTPAHRSAHVHRRSKPAATGTHTVFLGRLDCVSQRVLCEFSLVAIGIAAGLILVACWLAWRVYRKWALKTAVVGAAASMGGPLGVAALKAGRHLKNKTMRG